VVDGHGGAELQIAGQSLQVGHPFLAQTARAVVFIFLQTMALCRQGFKSIHRDLLDLVPPQRGLLSLVVLVDQIDKLALFHWVTSLSTTALLKPNEVLFRN